MKIKSWIFQVASIEDFEKLTEDEKLNVFTPTANEIRYVNAQSSDTISVFHTSTQTLCRRVVYNLLLCIVASDTYMSAPS